jgi:hypothetical protein
MEAFYKIAQQRTMRVFKAARSREIIRVIQDDNRIIGYDEYLQKHSIKTKWISWKKNMSCGLYNVSPATIKPLKWDIIKTTSTNKSTGETRTGHGKFHFVLRRENGTWKILVDAKL